MPWNEDEYKEWQDGYESLEEEWDEDWSDEKKRDHLENMKTWNEQYVCRSLSYPSRKKKPLCVHSWCGQHPATTTS